MTTHERLSRHLGTPPDIGAAAFIAANASILGNVALGRDSSVWYQAVLRGDINAIRVGEGTNIQDGAILHLADDHACEIGVYTTVGHGAIVHACRVGDECLIGMGAVILDGAVIGNQCMIGARALVTQRMVIPDGSMVLGMPGKVVRPLTEEERKGLRKMAEKYVIVAKAHHNASTTAKNAPVSEKSLNTAVAPQASNA